MNLLMLLGHQPPHAIIPSKSRARKIRLLDDPDCDINQSRLTDEQRREMVIKIISTTRPSTLTELAYGMGADCFKTSLILKGMEREGLLKHEIRPPAKGRTSAKRWKLP